MAGSKSLFDEYLAQEVENSKGVFFPVKTGILSRLLIREARCDDLHPNPEDEFCSPQIGPNYKIISAYQQQYVDALKMSQHYYEGEPIIVERTHPEGYRIINGHHRWAAALRIGQAKIPIRIEPHARGGRKKDPREFPAYEARGDRSRRGDLPQGGRSAAGTAAALPVEPAV